MKINWKNYIFRLVGCVALGIVLSKVDNNLIQILLILPGSFGIFYIANAIFGDVRG